MASGRWTNASQLEAKWRVSTLFQHENWGEGTNRLKGGEIKKRKCYLTLSEFSRAQNAGTLDTHLKLKAFILVFSLYL